MGPAPDGFKRPLPDMIRVNTLYCAPCSII
jgi:hypothetical protein